jgi:histidinol-phosphate aminotransferase
MSLRVTPAPGVMEITAYVAGAAKADGIADPARLASNEAALGPSPKALAAASQASAGMARYPDPSCLELREAIALRYGCDADRIVCGAGSESLIHVIGRAYLGPGTQVLIPRRAFAGYRIVAQSCGAEIGFVEERADHTLDVDAMLGAVTPRTRVVFVANPNNPTGALTPASEIARLRAGLPQDVLLVIDAAYRDYVRAPDYSAGLELVGEDQGNVAVLGTFSKVYALAGMRVGWLCASRDIVDVLNRVRPAFGVPLPAQAAAIAALEDTAHIGQELAYVARERPKLVALLSALGFEVAPACANFVLARVPPHFVSGSELTDALAREGVLIRPVTNYGLPLDVRISIGSPTEMAQLRSALMKLTDRRLAS